MSKNFEHFIHKRSNATTDGKPKLPTSSQIEYGELAVNYAKDKETISLKNSSNEIVTFSSDSQILKQTLRIMGVTPVTHTLADNADSYYVGQLQDNEVGAWFISYSDGNLIIKPSTQNDEAGRIKLSSTWQSRLNYGGMTWANVGDILLVYRQSSLIVAYKVLSINEAGETRIGLMSPNDKIQVNKISGIESALNNKLPYSTSDANIGNVGDGAYTNVTSGRTNWIDSSSGGGAIKLGNLQFAVDPSGRIYSRNQTMNNGTWNITNQLVTIGGTNLDNVFVPSVVGYGICQNGPTENPLTVYTFTSSDLDGNGFRSILQVAIDRTDSTPYIRTTFYRPSNNDFTKTNWVKIPNESEFVTVTEFEGTEKAIAAALNDINTRIGGNDNNIGEKVEELQNDLQDFDLIVSSSLNDLNSRLDNNEDEIAFVDKRITDIEENAADYTNVIETVKVNGTALTPDSNKAVDIPVATKTSELENDSGYITDKEKEYLSFVALESGAFGFTHSVDGAVLYYSKNDGEWTALTGTVDVVKGDVVRFKGELTPVDKGIGTFTATGDFNVEGNVMSLLYGDNFKGVTDLTGKDYVFRYLFRDCTNVISAKDLSLSATTLAMLCYGAMFYDCTNLITAPALPAITLAMDCYRYMFYGCASLMNAPDLPATTLADYCYSNMFNGCTSLTTAPALPATTLGGFCYEYMFNGCTSLTTAPELPAMTLIYNCYTSMFQGCTSLNYIKAMFTTTPSATYTSNWVKDVASSGTFISSTAWTFRGVNSIPHGWNIYIEPEWEYVHEYEITEISSNINNKITNISNRITQLQKNININISSDFVVTNERIEGLLIRKILIPIDSVDNAYLDNAVISETKIVPYINTLTGENYLILKLGSLISSDCVVTEAHIIGIGIYSTPDIRYVDSNMYIYPKLPLGITKDNLQNLIVSYYNNSDKTAYRIWFDDYPYEDDGYASLDEWAQNESDATDWNSYVATMLNDDDYDGANPYIYTGETFEWNGSKYYLWELDNSTGIDMDNVRYILTYAISYNELYEHSLEANPQNHWCPYVAVLTSDKEVYRTAHNGADDDILVKVEPATE